jgi:hypothetical protein
VPHHLLAAALWEVPRIGVQLAVNANVQSGATFTVYDSANTTNGFPAGTLRPNLAGNPAGDGSLQHYYNTAAFVHPASFRFGNSPRSVLRGPTQRNVDFSAAKSFPITERFRTEFRGQFFNVFNIANFDVPGHTLGNADFGIVNSARPARTIELALRVLF